MPGVTLKIIEAAGAAYQQAYVVDLRTTALSSLSFGICEIIGKSACDSGLVSAPSFATSGFDLWQGILRFLLTVFFLPQRSRVIPIREASLYLYSRCWAEDDTKD